MDANDLRAALTVLMLVIFVAIVWWSYSSKRQQAFDEAAHMPFTEDEELVDTPASNHAQPHAQPPREP